MFQASTPLSEASGSTVNSSSRFAEQFSGFRPPPPADGFFIVSFGVRIGMMLKRMPPTRRREPGERVGPFELLRYLASGGMGDVYVGRETASGNLVAIKFLADGSPANVERFEREGRIAATLSHPNIVSGRGYGRTDDGMAWLAMELLQGQELEARLASTGVSPKEAVSIALQVLDALEYAHGRRIIHRDLKPQNVFLALGTDPLGRGLHVKVLDFGIARFADERKMTGTGVIVGSWSYMSPEQACAQPDIDARSDLWSLGVVLYECLAGRLPFDAPTGPGTLYQILFTSPPPLAQVRPDLPSALIAIVHRALARSRDDRFASAAAFRAALHAIEPTSLPAVPQPRRSTLTPEADSVGRGETFSASVLGATMEGAQRAELTIESRLTSVVFLRDVRQSALLQDVARELQGKVANLVGDDALVVFGSERWNGDEPDRAVRLAGAVSSAVRSAGVATGRAVRAAAGVAGAALDTAVALSRRDGINIDATTGSIVRGKYPLTPHSDGSFSFDPHAKRPRVSMHEVGSGAPMLGRELELGVLLQSADTALNEQQSTGVVVLSAAGLGKSRLRQEAMVELLKRDPDATAVSVRCEAFRRDTPFAALTEALREFVDESVLSALVHAGSLSGDPGVAQDRARNALEAALRSLTTRGVVVLSIDDVQWLDAPTLAALRWLGENAPELPMAVWLFGRPEAKPAAVALLPSASVLELKTLSRSAAEQLLRAMCGQAPEALLERAAGHPLFLEELGRMFERGGSASLSEALPPSIEGAFLAQLDQLDPADREYLKRAAIFGRTAWHDAVASLGADAGGFDALKRMGLLVSRPRSRFEPAKEFTFRSGVMQEVAYGLWTDEQRPRLHERAAIWLAGRSSISPDELARHWDLAGDAVRASEAWAAAAELSSRLSADPSTTLQQTDRVLALSSDPKLRWRALVARDNALHLAGDRVLQREGLVQMAALAEQLGSEQGAEAAWRECLCARVMGDYEAATKAGERALALAREGNFPRLASAAENELALICADQGSLDEALSHALEGRALAEKVGDEWLNARVAAITAYVLGEMGRPAEALALEEQAAARFARAGDRPRESQALCNAAFGMLELGRVRESIVKLREAIEAAKRAGNPRSAAIALQNLATALRIVGAREEAKSSLEVARSEARRLKHLRLLAAVAVEAVYLALAEGEKRWSVLGALSKDALDAAATASSPSLSASALAAELRARTASGQEAHSAIEAARSLLPTLERVEEAAFELRVGLVEASGLQPDDVAGAKHSLERWILSIDAPEERPMARAAVVSRYLVPQPIAQ